MVSVDRRPISITFCGKSVYELRLPQQVCLAVFDIMLHQDRIIIGKGNIRKKKSALVFLGKMFFGPMKPQIQRKHKIHKHHNSLQH